MAAQDDPEVVVVLEQVKRHTNGNADIHIYSDPKQVGDLEVNAFQTASEVVLQKSLREGFGLTVAEAQWKGSPVIGGNCGGIRVQIEDGKTGYLVRVGDADSLATSLTRILTSPAMAQRMGQEGRARAKAFFDERDVLDRQGQAYPRILAERPPNATVLADVVQKEHHRA